MAMATAGWMCEWLAVVFNITEGHSSEDSSLMTKSGADVIDDVGMKFVVLTGMNKRLS